MVSPGTNVGRRDVYTDTTGTAATFAANTSGIANDTATFDGFTLGQVVLALENCGILVKTP